MLLSRLARSIYLGGPGSGRHPGGGKAPYEQTRTEFRKQENGKKVAAIHEALGSGKQIVHATSVRATGLTKPSQIRANPSSGDVEIQRGKNWDKVSSQNVQSMTSQAGVKPGSSDGSGAGGFYDDPNFEHSQSVKDAAAAGQIDWKSPLGQSHAASYPDVADEHAGPGWANHKVGALSDDKLADEVDSRIGGGPGRQRGMTTEALKSEFSKRAKSNGASDKALADYFSGKK